VPIPASLNRSAWLVVGAVAGSILRFTMIMVWPNEVEVFVSTLLIVGLAGALLGMLASSIDHQHLRAVLSGLVGSAASLSVVALVAVSSTPLLCAAYLVAVPAAAVGGLALGVLTLVQVRGPRDKADVCCG
jgi:CrcB protein